MEELCHWWTYCDMNLWLNLRNGRCSLIRVDRVYPVEWCLWNANCAKIKMDPAREPIRVNRYFFMKKCCPDINHLFFSVFVKNSLIKKHIWRRKKVYSRTWFFCENSAEPGVFWPRGLKAIHGNVRKSAIFPPPDNQNDLNEAILLVWIKKALLPRWNYVSLK